MTKYEYRLLEKRIAKITKDLEAPLTSLQRRHLQRIKKGLELLREDEINKRNKVIV